MSDVEQLLSYSFMVNALAAGSIVAVMAAVVGWLMVVRRESFAGHTLSVMSFPGAALAALVGWPLVWGYYLFCAGGAIAIAAGAGVLGRRDLAQESAATGTVQVAALALGFVFLSLYGGVLENLETLLFGSFLGISSGQVLTLAAVAVTVLACLALAGRPLLLASVDEVVARARGVPVRALSVAFLLMLGLSVAATAQITGSLLVFALLVAPAAAAQQLTARIGMGLALSVALGLAVTWLGLGCSYFTNWPVGFTITTLAFLVYVAARMVRLA
ncbi:MAG TPA: metal ABC transporter permease [Solirubrobacteraceae bacterium]|nr:metal ABC transporter permease [Solirubrobacteraceae bacterium]